VPPSNPMMSYYVLSASAYTTKLRRLLERFV